LNDMFTAWAIFGSFFLEFPPAAAMFIIGSPWVGLSHYWC
jgi:hypothetical protein